MNILIITTIFPPDSAIASVRPYMFAKHLAAAGEKITVIRSGYFEMPPYDDYTEAAGFEVLSALGRDCDAEKYKRGEYDGFKVTPKRKLRSLPRCAGRRALTGFTTRSRRTAVRIYMSPPAADAAWSTRRRSLNGAPNRQRPYIRGVRIRRQPLHRGLPAFA